MTTVERKDLIGQTVKYKTAGEGFLIDVKVLDHKVSYGRDRYLITPRHDGEAKWVESIYRVTDDHSQI